MSNLNRNLNLIEIKNLRKAYPNVTPLKDVSVTINKGDVISVIGPSGTGKSTLLRCMNLLETPTSGQIFIDGEEITAKNCDVPKVRQKMGMVFQSFNLFAHKNVIENIMLGPVSLLKQSPQEAYENAMRLLQTVGLADKAFNYPDELSGGQKQRIAIVRTLAMNPEIILFDEPTSALDPTMVGEVLAVIRNLAKQGLTMMIVTHEMKFARNVSNRIFYMDEGGIYEDGTPEQIFENPQKEKTRQFINHLKVLKKEIALSGADGKLCGFDFPALYSEIETFSARHAISQKKRNAIFTVVDELLIETIVGKEIVAQNSASENISVSENAPCHAECSQGIIFMLEYSEETETATIQISWASENKNPLDACDEVSASLLKNATSEITHSFDGGKNCVKILVK